MRGWVLVAVTVTAATAAPAQEAAKGKAAEGTAVSAPHAGVSFVLPPKLQLFSPVGQWGVVRAVETAAGREVMAVTLSVFPVDEEITADDYADGTLSELKKNLAVRSFELRKKTELEIAGLTAAVRGIRFSWRGTPTYEIQSTFIRDLKQPPKLRLCYQLTVKANQQNRGRMAGVLVAVIRSLKLIRLRHPSELAAPSQGLPWKDDLRNYVLQVPHGWFVFESPAGAVIGLMDYLEAGRTMLAARVLVSAVRGATGTEADARNALQKEKQAVLAKHPGAKVASEGPAEMGGVKGYQLIVSRPAEQAAAAAGGANASDLMHVGYRMICIPRFAGSSEGRAYSLVIACPHGTPERLASLLDSLAAGFLLLKKAATTAPASQPTTQPATQPATQPTTEPATQPATRGVEPATRPAGEK
jgi:hypothetical protein